MRGGGGRSLVPSLPSLLLLWKESQPSSNSQSAVVLPRNSAAWAYLNAVFAQVEDNVEVRTLEVYRLCAYVGIQAAQKLPDLSVLLCAV